MLLSLFFVEKTATVIAGTITTQDLGYLPGLTNILRTLKWRNTTTNTFNLRTVESSCECLEVLSFSRNVIAGQEAEFSVRLHTPEVGPVEFGLLWHVDSESDPRLLLLSAQIQPAKPRPYPDHDFLVSAEELLQGGTNNTLVVDVRSSESYQAAHIPGSVNIPLYQVRTKDFLRSRNITLVNDGYEQERLLDACNLMREANFISVHMLSGGLRRWHQLGGALQGSEAARYRGFQLMPSDYFQARYESGWLLIDARSSSKAPLPPFFHMPKAVAFTGNTTDFVEALLNIVSENNQSHRILVLADQEKDQESIRHGIEGLPLPPLFFLAGGTEKYREFLDRHLAGEKRRTVTISDSSLSRYAHSGSWTSRGSGCGCGNRH